MQKLFRSHPRAQPPAIAYDLWADTYDCESGNLMIALDEIIFPELLNDISVRGKTVADIGCGTGRHWPLLLSLHPARLYGYDVSKGMLKQLKQKYPAAQGCLITDHMLPRVGDASIDLIVSTLTLAYVTSLEQTFKEWNRVLKPGGSIVFTSYHPEALQHGGTITFAHNSGTIAIQHHIYTLAAINRQADEYGWTMMAYAERKIDESVKHFYEQQHALHVYEKFRDKPIIYGIHFRKKP